MIGKKGKDWTAIDQAIDDAVEGLQVIVIDATTDQAYAGAKGTRCPACANYVGLASDHQNMVKVHFAHATSSAPCVGSYKMICGNCGMLTSIVDGKTTHLIPSPCPGVKKR